MSTLSLEDKLNYLLIAYRVITEFKNEKGLEDKDNFLIKSSETIYGALTEILESYEYIFENVVLVETTESFQAFLHKMNQQKEDYKYNQSRMVDSNEIIDAAIGIGLTINSSVVEANRVNQQLEAEQMNEFNRMMVDMQDLDFSADCVDI